MSVSKSRRFALSAQYPKRAAANYFFPLQRSVFSGAGPLFATPEEIAAAEKATAERTALVDDVVTKVSERLKLPDFEKRLGGISKALHDVTETVGKFKPPEEKKETDQEKITIALLNKKFEDAEKAKQQTEESSRGRLARSAYADALKAVGINQIQARDLAKNFVQENGKKIVIGEDDAVFIRETDDGTPEAIGEIAKKWLGTDHGKAYLPPKGTNKSDGLQKESSSGPSIAGWNPKNKVEAMADPVKYAALKKERPEFVASLPEK